MTTALLKEKMDRYLRGISMPSEKRQIQTWLSSTLNKKESLPEKEKERIENEIVAEVQAYVVYSKFNPKPDSWLKKITAFF